MTSEASYVRAFSSAYKLIKVLIFRINKKSLYLFHIMTLTIYHTSNSLLFNTPY